ncbi:hypothetical protein T4B_1176 [Trichinella pseudospiralis]|uniref:Uncharacterized protein n=1 Tax=Trichinella pseudospiralis TaxID=6337 RepID=A0A0V1GKR3_TRIPS|nr:hypothetical protein T4B_5447 [Trichinella pseudospiralis]KRY99378.1 hypothetical protein T4B_1176 [Trichinella pseudospiralis]
MSDQRNFQQTYYRYDRNVSCETVVYSLPFCAAELLSVILVPTANSFSYRWIALEIHQPDRTQCNALQCYGIQYLKKRHCVQDKMVGAW